MRFVDSRCIHCGAALRVAPDATHVCCQYCQAELQIVRDGPELTTRLLDEIQENLGQKLDILRLQNDLERLDREWAIHRERFMVSSKDGSKSIPSSAGSLIGGLIAAAFGMAWIVFTSRSGAPGFFPLFGVLFVGLALWGIISGMSKATAHGSAEAAYQARRRLLLTDLAHLQSEQ